MIKLFGVENEYIAFFNTGSAETQVILPKIKNHPQILENANHPILCVKPNYYLTGPFSSNLTFDIDNWLKNGGRAYKDSDHIEYASPECETIEELVLAEKAGEKIITKLFEEFEPEDLYVLKRTTGAELHLNKTAGSHENYSVRPSLFQKLVQKESPWTPAQIILLAHLSSRIIYTGSGHLQQKVLNKNRQITFWISPRTIFLESIVIDVNRIKRPFIHSRVEPLVEPNILPLCRLHLICGDMNRSEWSLYLKYGTTALLLSFLEIAGTDEIISLASQLNLFNYLDFSRSISLEQTNFFQDKGSFGKAAFFQRKILKAIKEKRGILEEIIPETDKIILVWENTLEDLISENGKNSRKKLDWLIKKGICEEKASLPISDLSNLENQELILQLLQYDLSYHRVNIHDLYGKLLKYKLIESLYPPKAHEQYILNPPEGRAKRRVEIIKYALSKKLENNMNINWQVVRLHYYSPLLNRAAQNQVLLDYTDTENLKLIIDNFKNKIEEMSNARTNP